MRNLIAFLIGFIMVSCNKTEAQETVYSNTAVNSLLDTIKFTFSYTQSGSIDTLQVLWRKPYVPPTPPINVKFTVDTIPYSDPEVYGVYRGMNNFQNNQTFTYPATLNYFRVSWASVQTDVNNFNWSQIDGYIKTSIANGQQVGFRFGAVDNSATSGTVTINGVRSCYPLFVHNLMNAESIKDWNDGTAWYPNWNSNSFLSAWESFIKSVQQYVDSKYPYVTYAVDIGGYGNYLAEWHMYNINQAAHNTVPTDASLKRMMDAHKVFSCWLINNIDMFDLKNVSAAFSYYAITSSNSKGMYGLRSDHLANLGTMNYDTVVANVTYNGINFKNAIKLRYQFAPMCGEPMPDVNAVTPPNGTPYQNLIKDVQWYKTSYYSNVSSSTTSAAQSNFTAASKLSGYRLQVNGGIYSPTGAGGCTLILNWVNDGIAPIYSDWTVNLEIRNGSNVVWSGKSIFNPKLFLPGRINITDNLSGIPAGNYNLYVIFKDPNGVRKPLALTNKNRGSDGAYLLTNIVVK